MQWCVLIGLSLLFGLVLELASFPAALLIGPMLAAIVAGTHGATVRTPKLAFAGSQAVVGVLIAASLSPAILKSFASGWPLFMAVVVATVGASSFLGYLISRWKIMPGTTGVWGASPGAATAMVLMADAFGADARLVAFMQYLRVILVTLAAAAVARLWVDTSGITLPRNVWFPPIEPGPFGATLAVVVLGGLLGRLARLPSPYFLGALIVGIALHLPGYTDFQLPEWLLALAYTFVGWAIGLNFDRAILRHATRAMPQIVLSIVLLIAFCGGLAWLLVKEAGVDPLTAYLATSPGGMDSVAIIAAASDTVNMSFVMAMQSVRFLFVLILGPPIARTIARLLKE